MKPGATLAAAAALLLSSCLRIPVDEGLLFMPPPAGGPAWRPAGEDLRFEARDGTRINAWFLARPRANATVLFFGGNAFAMARSRAFVEAMDRHHVSLFLMDYRGYGRSEGVQSAAAIESDALQAYDVLRRRFEPDPRRIVVHGHSMGSFAAALVASERPVAALVLQNPATDAREAARGLVPWYLRPFARLEIAPALLAASNLERIRRVSAPTLVAAGGRDRITPPGMARRLYAASAAADKRLLIAPAADHNNLAFDEAFHAAYGELLARLPR